MPVTSREILQEKIADALATSHKLCIAASASLTASNDYIDQSRKAIARSQACLLRAAAGGSPMPDRPAPIVSDGPI